MGPGGRSRSRRGATRLGVVPPPPPPLQPLPPLNFDPFPGINDEVVEEASTRQRAAVNGSHDASVPRSSSRRVKRRRLDRDREVGGLEEPVVELGTPFLLPPPPPAAEVIDLSNEDDESETPDVEVVATRPAPPSRSASLSSRARVPRFSLAVGAPQPAPPGGRLSLLRSGTSGAHPPAPASRRRSSSDLLEMIEVITARAAARGGANPFLPQRVARPASSAPRRGAEQVPFRGMTFDHFGPILFLLGGNDPFELLARLGDFGPDRGATEEEIGQHCRTWVMPDSKKRARAEGAEDDDPTCSICLEALEPGAQCATLPCNHDFHQKCISTWLKQNKVCCLCKHPITEPRTGS